MEQVAKRGCGVAVMGIQHLTGEGSAQPAYLTLFEQGDWTLRSLRVPFNLHHSVILCSYL